MPRVQRDNRCRQDTRRIPAVQTTYVCAPVATMPRPTFVRSARGVLTHALGNLAAIAAVVEGLRALNVENPTTAALLLLLVVLGAATISGIWIATAISVVAMLALNYFFLPPVGTFTIADPQNWVALVVFLVVAGIANQLSSTAQTRARDAIDWRLEVSRLFDLSRDILLTTDIEAALPSLAQHIARRFEIQSVAIAVPEHIAWSLHQGGLVEVSPSEQQLNEAFARQRGVLEVRRSIATYGGHAEVTTADGLRATLVPLRLGTRTVGMLATQAGVLEAGTLDALAGVVAIAIERVHFLRGASHRGYTPAASRPRVYPAGVAQSRSAHAAHSRAARRHEPGAAGRG